MTMHKLHSANDINFNFIVTSSMSEMMIKCKYNISLSLSKVMMTQSMADREECSIKAFQLLVTMRTLRVRGQPPEQGVKFIAI